MFDGIRLASAYIEFQPKVDNSALLKEARKSATSFQKQMQAQLAGTSHLGGVMKQDFQGLRAGVRGMAKDYDFATQSQSKFTRSTQALKGAVSPVLKHMNNISKGISGLGRQVGLTAFQFGVAGTTITAFVTGPLAAATALMTKFGLQAAMNIEDATVRLKGLLPAGIKVEKLVDRLIKKAQASPVFGPEDALKFVQDLVGAGTDVKQAEKTYDSIDAIFRAYGVHGPDAQKAILGVTQVIRKGRAYSEELTQQIGEQIPIWHLLAKAAGKTQKQFQQDVKDGKITADVFQMLLGRVAKFPEVMKAAADGSKTLSAQWEQLKEQMKTQLAMGFLKNFPKIKQALHALEPVIKEVITYFVQHIDDALRSLDRLILKIKDWKKVWDGWQPQKKQEIIKTVGILAAAGPLLTVFGGVGSMLNGIVAAAGLLFNPSGLLILGVGAAAVGLFALYQNSKQFRDMVAAFIAGFKQGWYKWVVPAFHDAADAVNTHLMPALTDMAHALGFKDLKSFGTWLGTAFAGAIANAVHAWAMWIDVLTVWIRYMTGVIEMIKSVYKWISSLMKRIWDFQISSVLALYKLTHTWIDVWVKIKDWTITHFKDMVAGIKSHWDKLGKIFKDPVTFLIETVYDKGILPIWNAVASKFGGKALQPVHMSTGGQVPGSKSVGDWVPIYATAGERVLSLDQVSALGGHNGINALLGMAGASHYADGGVVGRVAGALAGVGSRLIPGAFMKTLGPAFGLVKKMINGSELKGGTPWMQDIRNIPTKIVEGLVKSIKEHDIAPAASSFYQGGLGGAVPLIVKFMQKAGIPFGVSSSYRSKAIDPNAPNGDYHMTGNAVDFVGNLGQIAKYWYKNSGGLLEEIYSGGSGYFVKNGNRVPRGFYGAATEADHFDHVHIAATKAAMEMMLGGGRYAGAGVGRWAKAVGLAMSMTHVPTNWASGIMTIMQRESGGNPRAINLNDINAQHGDPSRGLMQVIGSTFKANHQPGTSWDIYDPVANIAAAINYIKHRYGSIFKVQQANPNMPPRGYDFGGPVGPGDHFIRNSTGRTEMMLNPSQGKALEDRIRGGGGDTYIIKIGDEEICRIVDGRVAQATNGIATILKAGKKV